MSQLSFHAIHAAQEKMRADLQSGALKVNVAKEMNNALGKSVAMFRAILEQYEMRKEKPEKVFTLAAAAPVRRPRR